MERSDIKIVFRDINRVILGQAKAVPLNVTVEGENAIMKASRHQVVQLDVYYKPAYEFLDSN